MATSTKIFSLHGRGLKLDSRADIAPLLQEVDPAVIEEIHFGGNTIGVEASLALAEFLEKTQALKIADFADIFTGRLIDEIPQALSAICDALKDKTTLVEINLSDNAFGGRSVDPIVPFLTHNRSFQIFKLNNNGLGPAGGAVIANALTESARLSKQENKPSNLRTVICGRNRLEDGSATAWATAFKEHGGLKEIRMPQNGIRMDGIAALVKGIAECKDLEYLDFQDNTFGELGSQTIATVLDQWPNLHTLNLSDCVLAEEGSVSPVVEKLVEGSNPKLHTLLLQNNNFDSATFSLLAQNVDSDLKALQRLELQWNEVEEDDASLAVLARVLKARGGKLVTEDEDEEDEGEGEEEEEEEKEEKEAEEEKKGEDEEAKKPAAPSAEEPLTAKSLLEKANDALADLMSKVSIGSEPSS
ncbi:RNI-like protein [Trametopsis cervina]|nr:RNI-like protein [Trametopsis cervina]